MKKRMIKYGSIDQFRQIVKLMQRLDNPPTITVNLTEKIHGTNGSVCFSEPLGLWTQSKNNIITPENDNAGCAQFIHEHRIDLINAIREVARVNQIDLNQEIITLYFEWCGGNIQKNSCVSGLSKRAILFDHFRVSGAKEIVDDCGNIVNCRWLPLDRGFIVYLNHFYHVNDFDTWALEIDFNKPAEAQNRMLDIVAKIEANSPIGQQFSEEPKIGEGVVGTFFYQDRLYRFKVKGEKHSPSKVKTMKPGDPVKEGKIAEFVNDHACKAWRFEQAWQNVFGIENEIQEPTVKATGDFLRAVHQDVIKEESDILESMELTQKEVNGQVSKVARNWFMEQLDQYAGL